MNIIFTKWFKFAEGSSKGKCLIGDTLCERRCKTMSLDTTSLRKPCSRSKRLTVFKELQDTELCRNKVTIVLMMKWVTLAFMIGLCMKCLESHDRSKDIRRY